MKRLKKLTILERRLLHCWGCGIKYLMLHDELGIGDRELRRLHKSLYTLLGAERREMAICVAYDYGIIRPAEMKKVRRYYLKHGTLRTYC